MQSGNGVPNVTMEGLFGLRKEHNTGAMDLRRYWAMNVERLRAWHKWGSCVGGLEGIEVKVVCSFGWLGEEAGGLVLVKENCGMRGVSIQPLGRGSWGHGG
jgi:hypothetical protein